MRNYIKVLGHVYAVQVPPAQVRYRGAVYRLALQLPERQTDEDLAHEMVQECEPAHTTVGPRAKIFCVYPPNGDRTRFLGRHKTYEDALLHAQALLARLRTLRIPLTSAIKLAVIKDCREQDKDDRPEKDQKVCLYTSDGKRLLGRHPSKEKAEAQERAIHSNK